MRRLGYGRGMARGAIALLLGIALGAASAAQPLATQRVFISGIAYEVEVASDPVTRERGLSGRDSIDPRGGMLFVFPDDAPRVFWMRDCKVNIDMPPAVRKRFGLDTAVLFGPKGCDACRHTGYRGRVGVFEILPMAPDIASAIQQRMPPEQIQRDSGRHTLMQDGIRKVQAGLTTLDELLRVTA